MDALTSNNVQSELSYAYLHAVAAHAKVMCECAGRHEDNAGVDARLIAKGDFPGSYVTEVDVKVQLKATTQEPAVVNGHLSYQLRGISRYDALRSDTTATPRILVVLFLPKDPDQWLRHSEDALTLQRCAYWVSLKGAPPSANDTTQVIRLPASQRFDVPGLTSLVHRIAREQFPRYAEAA